MILALIAAGWFWTVTPPFGGPVLDIGPYNSLSGCRDWLGSAIYEFSCHPVHKNCVIVGNGYAYPADFAYPPPVQIPSADCFESNTAGVIQGNYFLLYDEAGAHLFGPYGQAKCKRVLSRTMGETGECFFIGNTGE